MMYSKLFWFTMGLVTAATLLIGPHFTTGAEPDVPTLVTHVDLSAKANQKLEDTLHGFEGNNLSELPQGDQTFREIVFRVRQGYIRLGSKIEMQKPVKVADIPVGALFIKLHALHGTGYGSYGMPGGPLFVSDGAQIGEYVVKYEDGTTASVPIVYGEDVRDWWNWDKPAAVTRGKIAWSGKNEMSRTEGQNIHVYLTTWINPHPTKKVAALDYISNGKTAAAPFCIAITLEH